MTSQELLQSAFVEALEKLRTLRVFIKWNTSQHRTAGQELSTISTSSRLLRQPEGSRGIFTTLLKHNSYFNKVERSSTPPQGGVESKSTQYRAVQLSTM